MGLVVIIESEPNLRLSAVPLIGALIPPAVDLQLDKAALLFATQTVEPADAKRINAAIALLGEWPALVADAPPAGGVSGRANYRFAGTADTTQIQLGGATRQWTGKPGKATIENLGTANLEPAQTESDLSVPSPNRKNELPVTPRTVGPLRLNGLQLGMKNGCITVSGDVTLTVSVLALTAFGLAVTVDPRHLATTRFTLDGVGVALNSPTKGISLVGALRHTTFEKESKKYERYEGGLLLSTQALSATLVGAYQKGGHGETSMYLFGSVSAAGDEGGFGPPPFRVKGLCLGGGYNSTIRLPSVAEIPTFRLLPGVDDTLSGPTPPTSDQLVESFDKFISPRQGENWFAAGLKWSTFECANFRAAAVVRFGDDLVVSLLALGDFVFPTVRAPGTEPSVVVEIAAELKYDRAQGVVSLLAQLTPNSYVYTRSCQLTGGLAACVWFAPSPYAGDFVFSVGGYFPGFVKPTHYPDVPRLGLDWSVSNEVTLSGQVYAALTPHAFMIGGAMALTYQSGSLSAWLKAGVDALIDWCKGKYDIYASVSVGISASVHVLWWTVSVHLELGVDLHVTGPPLGGTAEVHVWFTSFTVSFGESSKPAEPVPWKDFVRQLPPAKAALTVQASAGREPSPTKSPRNGSWYLNHHGFTLATQAAAPANKFLFNNRVVTPNDAKAIDIRPMKVTGATSEHRVVIRRLRKDSTPDPNDPNDYRQWKATATEARSPASMWGGKVNGTEPNVDGSGLLRCYTGLTISPNIPSPTGKLEVGTNVLNEDALEGAGLPLSGGVGAEGDKPAMSTETKARIRDGSTGIAAKAAQRTEIFTALQELHCPAGTNESVTAYLPFVDRLVTNPLLVAG